MEMEEAGRFIAELQQAKPAWVARELEERAYESPGSPAGYLYLCVKCKGKSRVELYSTARAHVRHAGSSAIEFGDARFNLSAVRLHARARRNCRGRSARSSRSSGSMMEKARNSGTKYQRRDFNLQNYSRKNMFVTK